MIRRLTISHSACIIFATAREQRLIAAIGVEFHQDGYMRHGRMTMRRRRDLNISGMTIACINRPWYDENVPLLALIFFPRVAGG